MNAKAIAILGATGLLVSGAGFGAYLLLKPRIEAPTLALHQEFPARFDSHQVPLRAISYEGWSKCTGLADLFTGDEWGQDGTMFAQPPTAKQILDANPIRDDHYKVVSHSKVPRQVNKTRLPEIRNYGTCVFQYEAKAWQIDAHVTNVKPTRIVDGRGTPFSFAITPVVLASEAASGSRFLLEGRATDPGNLTLDHRAFPSGRHDAASQLHGGVAAPIMHDSTSFVFVFDVPDLRLDAVDMMLIPTNAGALAGANAPSDPSLRFDRLFRLEPESAEHVLGTDPDASATASGQASSADVAVHAADPETAAREASQLPEALEAISSAATITYTAVEPRAPSGSTKTIQARSGFQGTTTTTIEVADLKASGTARVTHAWTQGNGGGTFAIRIAGHRLPSTSAVLQGTASVTQMGADGLVAARIATQGATASEAVVGASRLLSAKGHLEDLKDLNRPPAAKTNSILRASDRYFLAAAGLHAGWEWLNARFASDPTERLDHELNALQIVAAAVFSLTPEGLLVLSAATLGHYLLDKTGALEAGSLFMKAGAAGKALILGSVSREAANAAIAEAAPQIGAFAAANDAAVPAPEVRKTTPTPWTLGAAALLVAALSLAAYRRRGA